MGRQRNPRKYLQYPHGIFYEKGGESFIPENKRFTSTVELIQSLKDGLWKGSIVLPFNVDCEFRVPPLAEAIGRVADDGSYEYEKDNLLVTAQCRFAAEPENEGGIYEFPRFKKYVDGLNLSSHIRRHPELTDPAFIMRLRELGIPTVMNYVDPEILSDADKRKEFMRKPLITIRAYGHFLLVDLRAIFNSERLQLFLDKQIIRGAIHMKRRLQTKGKGLVLPITVTLTDVNGVEQEYRVSLQVCDSIALMGNAKYSTIAENSGYALPYKDLMGEGKIERMHEMYYEEPANYDKYAKGDLHVTDILQRYSTKYRNIMAMVSKNVMNTLHPKPTFGSSTNQLFSATAYGYYEDRPTSVTTKLLKTKLESLMGSASSLTFASDAHSQALLLAKCFGGRCGSNNPLFIKYLSQRIIDMDIKGAYATAMRMLMTFFGKPVTIALAFSRKVIKGKGLSLRKVLHLLRKDNQLKDFTFSMTISTGEHLKYEQDLIPSWYDFNRQSFRRLLEDGMEEAGGLADVHTGKVKMITREIMNGNITSLTLEIIEQIWNKKQRADFLDKTIVQSISFYPTSMEVSLDKFKELEKILEDKGIEADELKDYRFDLPNAFKNVGYSVKENTLHYWHGVKIGELATDKYAEFREQNPKPDPLNELFKLFANGTYGTLISPFFNNSNMISGNLITGSVRAFMYCCEKGLFLAGSITDGHIFLFDYVLHRTRGNRPVDSIMFARMYAENPRDLERSDRGRFAPLETDEATIDLLEYGYQQLKQADGSLKWGFSEDEIKGDAKLKLLFANLNKFIGKHVEETLLQNAPLLRSFQFNIGIKNIHHKVVLHGSADYSFDAEVREATKMRGHEQKNKAVSSIAIDGDGQIKLTNDFSVFAPSQAYFKSVEVNESQVPIAPYYVKLRIIKPATYKLHAKDFEELGLHVGDVYVVRGRVNMVSLSGFKYQTIAQEQAWKKAREKNCREFCLGLELLFLNDNGTIDVIRAHREIDKAIREGLLPNQVFKKKELIKLARHPKVQELITQRKCLDDLFANLYKRSRLASEEEDVDVMDHADMDDFDPERQMAYYD